MDRSDVIARLERFKKIAEDLVLRDKEEGVEFRKRNENFNENFKVYHFCENLKIFSEEHLRGSRFYYDIHSICEDEWLCCGFFPGSIKKVIEEQEFLLELEGATALPFTEQRESLPTSRKKYDVFISHASSDKEDYVDELNGEIKKLGVSVFYDSDVIKWGDNWKKAILSGIEQAEFAIIVISENFFGREWTEKELDDFLTRQNESGQKIVLPILHNVSVGQMKEKYPMLSEIQAIEANNYSSAESIAVLFAGLLIERFR